MKTAIITGGTSGIGLATAKKFLSEKYNCVLVGRSREKFEKIQPELFGNFKFISADVGEVSDCEKVLSATVKNFGGVNILVNSAGIYSDGAINFTTEKDFDEIFKTNVKGTFFMIRSAVDELIKTRGAIVNVASDAGIRGNYFCAAYSASKGAVVALTKSVALELASFKIRVNCVAPGDIFTPLTENQLKKSGESLDDLKKIYPLGKIGEAEEVADAIFFLASERANFITGAVLPIDGGLTA